MNVTEFIELWAQGDTATNFFYKRVKLVLGHRDVVKDHFIQFLAQNDSRLQIINTSTSFKPTPVPVKVHTVSSNVTICDFDSFDDSTESVGLPLGISSTYILQKIISSSDELQIILLINFSSTKHGIDQHHFTAQIRKISSWIKNIDNYANSIGLIVTNVANAAENQVLVDFDQILNHVEKYLEQLRKENSENLPMLKLLNILLKKTKGADYERIGIFRQPDDQILTSQIELVQKEWLKIKALLNDIQYSPININDFNFYSQQATNSSAHSLTSSVGNALDERIAKRIDTVFQQLENEFEKDIHNDYAKVQMKLQKMDSIQGITRIPKRDTKEVILDLESKLIILNIRLSKSFFDDIFKLIDYLQFLISVDNNLKVDEWQKAVEKITDYVGRFQGWNSFLREMDSTMSSYAVQKNAEKLYNIFIDKPITELNDERLQQFVKDYNYGRLSIYYDNVKGQKFQSLKIFSLESIFRSNLKPKIVSEINNSTGVTNVFGEYIFLGDIMSKFPQQKFLSINAASKIFIDTNITRLYMNEYPHMLSIISPVWELIETQNVQIILDGRKGWPSFMWSRRGHFPGGTGEDGKVGEPGYPAGHFFGVGDLLIHNGRNLSISANGGRGADGYKAGEGGDGEEGASAVTGNCERVGNFDSFQREELSGVLYHEYCVYGRRGGDGGRGGNGAVGAEGGFAGDITLVGFDKETNIQTSRIDGQKGGPSKGGKGGEAGRTGKSFRITKKVFWWGAPHCNEDSYYYCDAKNPASKAVNGAPGLDGYAREGLKNPVKMERPHWSSLLSTYRKYLLKDVPTGKLNEKKLSFLERLNKDLASIDLETANSLADEFFFLETQYQMAKNSIWISYFEQLLYRTERYLTTKHSANEDEIAKMVQEAILAKLISIKNQRSRSFIVNLKLYIEVSSERIKNFDPKSRASYMRNELWDRDSQLSSFVSVADENDNSVIDNNVAEITELISITQADMLNIFNSSYDQFDHKMAVLRTLITMKDTFHFLRFIEQKGKKILESTLPVNKYFFNETQMPAVAAELMGSVVQLTKTKLASWKKQLEPVLKGIVDNSTAVSAVNSHLKLNYNSLLETGAENFYENSRNIREFVRKIVSFTAVLKTEDQDLIKKLQNMWFLCESEFENCHLLENHKNVAHALSIMSKCLIFSKVQRFSDNIIDISESYFSGALKNPQDMVLNNSNLTNSLLQIQILFQRIRQSFKLPIPELVEHGLDALEADTKRIECFYTDVAYYQETKRFERVFHNKQSSLPIISDLSNSISLSILQFTYQNQILIPFYQLDFPFAYEDAEDVEIIADNYHSFKIKASSAIDRISSKIRRGPIIDGVSRAKDVQLMYSQLREIYRWKGEENEKTIENLFRGKPVTLKADILKYNSYQQAIRIRNVNLELQTKNQTLQKELDEDLAYFAVSLIHSGVSYYKCRDSIFTFTHNPLSLYHSFAKSSSNDRVDQNMVYDKLKDSDYLLSPFTIWRLSITNGNRKTPPLYGILKKYGHNIDIVLKAGNIYLIDDDVRKLPFVPNSSGDYCDSKAMRKYYKNEDIIFKMNSTNDFIQEFDTTDSKTSHRSKRELGHYESSEIAPEKQIIENKELNYSSNMNFSNYKIPLQNEIPDLNIAGAGGHDGIDICSSFNYNLNDCLVLLNLIVQRFTDSKKSHSYLRDCAVNYSKVRQCALDIIREFEGSLQLLSKNFEGEEYSFDPVLLMEELEQDIINNGGQNMNNILLNAVSPRKNPVKETFFQRLWNKLAKTF